MIDDIYEVRRNQLIGKSAYVDKRTLRVFFIDSKDHKNCFESKPMKEYEVAVQYAQAWTNGVLMSTGSLPDLSKRKVDTTPQPVEEIAPRPVKTAQKAPPKPVEKPKQVKKQTFVADSTLDDIF